ncbi:ATP-binding protein [Promicromonospora sp. NPDC059942]|uniref:ATP-binding protein n=1 Tax=Promicromonospora sp. NPDC059942 TaxID=3347009 RepID=UPI0036618C70
MTEALGPLLRRFRHEADLTLERLAELSGVSDRTISDIERGASLGPQRRTVDLVADGLGLAPADRAALLAAARAGRHRPPAGVVAPLPLPRAVADLVGRDAELSAIGAHVTSGADGAPSPLVVLSGPAVLGKTSLAVRAAGDVRGRFDAVRFLDLGGFGGRPLDPLQVLRRLIQSCEPAVRSVPHDVDEAAALWRSLLDDRRVLVVLDDAAGEERVRPVLPATGPSAVIVTARRPLAGLDASLRVELDRLAHDDAVTLLRRIIPAAQAPEADLHRLADLCDGCPLALRIAGNRVASHRAWTAGRLADRLASEDHRLDGFRAGDLELRKAFAMSYDQLSDAARTLFRRLGVLTGPTFTAELGAVLAGSGRHTAVDLLDELVDLGLLEAATHDRYHLHDLLRIFARDRLRQDEGANAQPAHAERLRHWILTTTVDAGLWFEPARGHGPDRPGLADLSTRAAASSWLHDEADHWFHALRAAAADKDDALVVRVAESLHWFSDLWVQWGQWHQVYDLAVQAAERLADDDLLATQLGYLSWAELCTRDDPARGLEHAHRARDVARCAGNRAQEGWALYYTGWCELLLGRPGDVVRDAQGARRCFADADDAAGLLQTHRMLAEAFTQLGRRADAIGADRAAIDLLERQPDRFPRDIALTTRVAAASAIVKNLVELGDGAGALATADAAASAVDELDVPAHRAMYLRVRALALAATGRTAEAAAALDRVVEIREALGDRRRADAARAQLAGLS